MNDKERITKIRQARTQRELNQATAGYREQILAVHAGLRTHYDFRVAIEKGQYFLALSEVRRWMEGPRGNRYPDVIRILECAADRQFALAKADSSRATARPCFSI
jgi:hypothetical protein